MESWGDSRCRHLRRLRQPRPFEVRDSYNERIGAVAILEVHDQPFVLISPDSYSSPKPRHRKHRLRKKRHMSVRSIRGEEPNLKLFAKALVDIAAAKQMTWQASIASIHRNLGHRA